MTTICGEEGAGTGSVHEREKDGLWAILLWLNILAERQMSAADILADHRETYGRDYYSRHDYEAVPADAAGDLMIDLRAKLPDLAGQTFAGQTVKHADEFSYHDSVDHSVSHNQGIRIVFESEARAVFRLSGTGTEGATLRLYLEQYAPQGTDHGKDTQEALRSVKEAAQEISGLNERLGRDAPNVMT